MHIEGDWPEVDKICSKPIIKNQKAFLYAVYKQQFLEYIENHETQRAFVHLNKRLKPLESFQTTPNEFQDLCYMLTCKSVHEIPSFKNWEGIGPSREQLIEQFEKMLQVDYLRDAESATSGERVPSQRLLTLFQQAVAYQVASNRYYQPNTTTKPYVESLLYDYTSHVIPNKVQFTFKGHEANIKCIAFAGERQGKLLSGSSDNTVRIWDMDTGMCESVLKGHTSRIWSLSSSAKGDLVISASGDKTLKLWDVEHGRCLNTFGQSDGDVYSVRYHPSNRHVASGGYDKLLRLYDLHTGQVVKAFNGHQLAITSIAFNPLGNLIVTGSKDYTVKFWDVASGLCVRTISSHLGEITSVQINEQGSRLLTCSKDNANRMWDMRTTRTLCKLKGHQNTSKNFVRAHFAPHDMVVGGSEDGIVYLWDQEAGAILQRLHGHKGMVYDAQWNHSRSVLCSASDDCTIKSWCYTPLHQ